MAYLNHAGTSWPKPPPVVAAAADALGSSPEGWGEAFLSGRATVAAWFGIPDPERLLLCPGATSALSVAVADHLWAPGDQLLISGLEHHALHRPCLKLAESAGVELVVAGRPEHGGLDMTEVRRALSAGRVRLVALTAASNVTGERMPWREVGALARQHGVPVLLDASQIAGWEQLDLPAEPVDLVAFAGHKGLQAPWGIGGLYVSPNLLMRSPAATCDPPDDGELAACALMPGFCDVGSVDRAALAGLIAGIGWLEGRPGRLARAVAQIQRLQEGAVALGGRLLGPELGRMPIAALTFPGRRSAAVGARLGERSVIVSAGLQCAPLAHQTLGTDPEGVVRFSAGPMTEDREIELALDALKEILQ